MESGPHGRDLQAQVYPLSVGRVERDTGVMLGCSFEPLDPWRGRKVLRYSAALSAFAASSKRSGDLS